MLLRALKSIVARILGFPIKMMTRLNKRPRFEAISIELSGKEIYSIRSIGPGDENKLHEFRNKLSDEAKSLFEGHHWDFRSLRRVVASSVKGDDLRLGAFDKSGQLVGYAFLQNYWAAVPVLGIAILDSLQNKGLGRGLMRCLLVEAIKANKRLVRLTVIKDNARAIGLYQKYGFKIIGQTADEKQREYHVMSLDLKEAVLE
ncbi:GNAT family N-acetyltransferase [Candidatus Saganbacteria bacterium]|nr:GNAT family N-acetyltransferase [Candidatus Saganbacteria bacterium]